MREKIFKDDMLLDYNNRLNLIIETYKKYNTLRHDYNLRFDEDNKTYKIEASYLYDSIIRNENNINVKKEKEIIDLTINSFDYMMYTSNMDYNRKEYDNKKIINQIILNYIKLLDLNKDLANYYKINIVDKIKFKNIGYQSLFNEITYKKNEKTILYLDILNEIINNNDMNNMVEIKTKASNEVIEYLINNKKIVYLSEYLIDENFDYIFNKMKENLILHHKDIDINLICKSNASNEKQYKIEKYYIDSHLLNNLNYTYLNTENKLKVAEYIIDNINSFIDEKNKESKTENLIKSINSIVTNYLFLDADDNVNKERFKKVFKFYMDNNYHKNYNGHDNFLNDIIDRTLDEKINHKKMYIDNIIHELSKDILDIAFKDVCIINDFEKVHKNLLKNNYKMDFHDISLEQLMKIKKPAMKYIMKENIFSNIKITDINHNYYISYTDNQKNNILEKIDYLFRNKILQNNEKIFEFCYFTAKSYKEEEIKLLNDIIEDIVINYPEKLRLKVHSKMFQADKNGIVVNMLIETYKGENEQVLDKIVSELEYYSDKIDLFDILSLNTIYPLHKKILNNEKILSTYLNNFTKTIEYNQSKQVVDFNLMTIEMLSEANNKKLLDIDKLSSFVKNKQNLSFLESLLLKNTMNNNNNKKINKL